MNWDLIANIYITVIALLATVICIWDLVVTDKKEKKQKPQHWQMKKGLLQENLHLLIF